jgi:hypothetical protein
MNNNKKWEYTQKPANERKFTALEMATALEITMPSFYALMKKLDLDYELITNYNSRKVMLFSHEALARCREELERRENKAREIAQEQQTELEAAQAEHPLVTDPRFLKLSYFPNIIPACFEEAE